MTLLRWIPVLSLGVVLGVVLVSSLSSPPVDFPFTEPPDGAALAAAEIQVGDRTLFGVVTGIDGAPLDGAGVSIQQGTRPYFTWTDAEGRFVLDELLAGDVRVLIVAQGFQATAFEVAGVQATSVAEPKPFVMDRPISAPPTPPGIQLADLSGKVEFSPPADENEGPREGYELLFQPTTAPGDGDGGFPRRVAVKSDGTFDVKLLHVGRYRTILLAPEDRGGSVPDLLAGADGAPRTFEHVQGDEVPTLVLNSTAGALRGVVYDDEIEGSVPGTVRGGLIRAERIRSDVGADTGQGNPSGRRLERSDFRAVQSGPSGKYVVRDLAPGRYLVSLVAGRRRQEFTVDIPPRKTVDFDLRPAQTTPSSPR